MNMDNELEEVADELEEGVGEEEQQDIFFCLYLTQETYLQFHVVSAYIMNI